MAQIALCYANLGNAQQAVNFIQHARAIDKNSVEYIYDTAEIYAMLGKTPEALKSLQESFEKHYPVEWATEDPELDSIRKDPKFTELIKKYSAKKP
jgi:tetratricopeptide (TPR) repeat protein